MTPTRRDFAAHGLAALGLAAPLAWAVAGPAEAMVRRPLAIAPGAGTPAFPQASAGAFELAIHDGADVIAADFVPSKDGILVALLDHELSGATDVAKRPQFASRKQTKTVDGEERTGWFAEDFTLAELKTLALGAPAPQAKAAGRKGATGPGHAILTFEEVVAVARAGSVRTARVIGIHAGLSHAAYFADADLAVEPILAGAIRVAGYDSPAAAMFVRGGDQASLKAIGELTRARRVFGLGPKDDTSPDGLKAIRTYAEAVAAGAGLLLDVSQPKAVKPTALVADAHAAGLAVHAWALGAAFPPPPFQPADAERLLAAFFTADADAVAGSPAAAIVRARAAAMARTKR